MFKRAGHGIQQGDSGQHHERGDRVRHRKVERPLKRCGLCGLQAAERKRRRAHQLKEYEQIEQIAGKREAAHRRKEEEHQRMEVFASCIDKAP